MKEKNKVIGKLDKNLAKLGDAIINFVISAALTVFYRKPTGLKVKNETLKRAWLSVYGRTGIKRGFMSPQDLAEAYIAYLWLNNKLSVENAVEVCVKRIFEIGPSSRNEIEKAIQACIEDLLKI